MEQIEQRTKEWFDQRAGKFTASEIHKLMTKTKEGDKLSQGAKSYVMDKLAERLTGYKETPVTMAMSWGIEYENLAKKAFQDRTGLLVKDSGFVSGGPSYGGSPDGLVYSIDVFGDEVFDKAIIEIKCPFDTATHLEYCLIKDAEDLPSAYYYQMQMNMGLCQANKCYFISFDPRIDHEIGLYVLEVPFNAEVYKNIDMKIMHAIQYMSELEVKLNLK